MSTITALIKLNPHQITNSTVFVFWKNVHNQENL